MSTLFVTSTGTDIGKTFVCCGLIRALPESLAVRCIKPVVTGFDRSAAAESDIGRLLAAQSLPVTDETIAATSPWRYHDAVSADVAAARESSVVPFDALVEFSGPQASAEFNLIEGIGGVMAPIDTGHTVLDWIGALEASVLLVVGSYLGTLSHTLTALEVLAARNRSPLAIVVSQSVDEPMPLAETAAVIERFSAGSPVIVLPRDSSGITTVSQETDSPAPGSPDSSAPGASVGFRTLADLVRERTGRK